MAEATGEAGEPSVTEEQVETELVHNRFNAVTASITKVTGADGRVRVRKRLGRAKDTSPEHWRASDEPRHWNNWRRELDAYLDPDLRASLAGTGLAMPGAEVEEDDDGATLWLEWMPGRTGADLTLDDLAAVARGLGRWQAVPRVEPSWTSRRFLREYSSSKPADAALVEDDAAWARPLVAELWPAGLREGWRRLLAERDRLYGIMEALATTQCHLDVWANNVTVAGDRVALFDWSFTGQGARGEDVGNLVPDGVFDLFWPGDAIGEADAATTAAYLDGLADAGWMGDRREVRLGICAAAVKYWWLLPTALAEAADPTPVAYWREVDVEDKYRNRGLGLAHLVGWVDEALSLAGQLGR